MIQHSEEQTEYWTTRSQFDLSVTIFFAKLAIMSLAMSVSPPSSPKEFRDSRETPLSLSISPPLGVGVLSLSSPLGVGVTDPPVSSPLLIPESVDFDAPPSTLDNLSWALNSLWETADSGDASLSGNTPLSLASSSRPCAKTSPGDEGLKVLDMK